MTKKSKTPKNETPLPPLVVGLCGFAESGKTTLARMMARERHFVLMSFADPLKMMLDTLLSAQGVEPPRIEQMLRGSLKGVAAPELGGKSPREAMQTLGTQWGRDLIAPDLWSDILARRAQAVLDRGQRVVIDDLRFLSEAEAIRKISPRAVIWGVSGRGGIDGAHASEAEIDNIAPDAVIDNSGAIDALPAEIARLLD
jgi:deoxynucleotide monophosphate kinase-like protein